MMMHGKREMVDEQWNSLVKDLMILNLITHNASVHWNRHVRTLTFVWFKKSVDAFIFTALEQWTFGNWNRLDFKINHAFSLTDRIRWTRSIEKARVPTATIVIADSVDSATISLSGPCNTGYRVVHFYYDFRHNRTRPLRLVVLWRLAVELHNSQLILPTHVTCQRVE